MHRLVGKVVIVTGAAGGIGAVTATAAASEGASVVVADVDAEAADARAAAIRSGGGQAIALPVDIGSEASIEAMIAATVSTFGGLDVLHNNAAATTLAATKDGMIHEASAETWTATFQVNVIGTMLGIKHALPHLLARGGGSIINTASAAGHLGDLGHPAYGASKAAVVSLTQYAATMYGKQGVRVNAISPGFIATPATTALPEEITALMLDNQLTPRVGLPFDIAMAVVYLASDESAYVTGQVLHVDGGAGSHQPYYAQMLRGVGWS